MVDETTTEVVFIIFFIVVEATRNVVIEVHLTVDLVNKTFKRIGSYFVRFAFSFVFLSFKVRFSLFLLVRLGLVLPRTRCLCTTRTRMILLLIRRSRFGFLLLSLPLSSSRRTLLNNIGSISRCFVLYGGNPRSKRTNRGSKVDLHENALCYQFDSKVCFRSGLNESRGHGEKVVRKTSENEHGFEEFG